MEPNLTPEALAALRAALEKATRDPSDDNTCARCGDPYALDDGADPSALCHPCAQATLGEIAHALPALLAERDALRRALAKALVCCYDGQELRASYLRSSEALLTTETTIAGRERDLRAIAEEVPDAE